MAAALLSAAMLAAAVSAVAAGPAAAASGSGGPGVSRATARAVALGFLRHRGAVPWQVLIGDAGVPGAARGVPTPGDSSQLEGVFCTAFVNCWAVGDYASGGATRNLMLHWNGKKWARVSVPNPGGTGMNDFSELFAVRCVKPSDCWAVGNRRKANGPDLDQALHWNGKRWAKVSTPTPGGTLRNDFNDLFELFCPSSSSCWAVGDYGTDDSNGGEVVLNQALHWNGTKWTQVHTPNPAGVAPNDGNALDSVRCSSAKDCWAVGTYGSIAATERLHNLALHWNGTKWTQVHTPNPAGTADGDINELIGLSCTARANCWAAGTDGVFGNSMFFLENTALHWNGKKWTQVHTPNPGGTANTDLNQLNGVSCTDTTNCWAVGEFGNIEGSTGTSNEAMHWNGKKWATATTPDPGGTATADLSQLNGVRCTSTIHCWAVGFAATSMGPDFNQALRWNGTKWSRG